MRSVSVLLIVLVIVVAMASAYPINEKVYYDLREAPVLFEKFIKDYNKHYKDVEDKYVHYFAFFMNLVKINRLNQIDDNASYDINELTDYTKEEFDHINGVLPIDYHE